MDRSVKVAIFPGNLTKFHLLLPKLLGQFQLPDSKLPVGERFELGSFPKENIEVENVFQLLEPYDNLQKSAILTALNDLAGLDPDRDYEIFARNALPILKWVGIHKEALNNIIRLLSSSNPYIYRRYWRYSLVSREDNNNRAGIEAYQSSYPLEYTIVQFVDGYDPIEYKFYQHIGNQFEEIVDFVIARSSSNIVAEQQYEWLASRTEGVISLQLGKPGAKSDLLYNAAFEQIYNGGKEEEVYENFCVEAKIAKPNKRDRDSFKAAIRRRNNKMKSLYAQSSQKIKDGGSQKEVFEWFCEEIGFQEPSKKAWSDFLEATLIS